MSYSSPFCLNLFIKFEPPLKSVLGSGSVHIYSPRLGCYSDNLHCRPTSLSLKKFSKSAAKAPVTWSWLTSS